MYPVKTPRRRVAQGETVDVGGRGMRVSLSGHLSLQIEDEPLYDGRSVPVLLKAEVEEQEISFSNGKARIRVDVPVDLKISEHEWSRAVGEILARSFRQPTP